MLSASYVTTFPRGIFVVGCVYRDPVVNVIWRTRPTLVAIAAVGLGVGSYLVHMTGKSKGQGTVMEKGEFDKLAEKVASRK